MSRNHRQHQRGTLSQAILADIIARVVAASRPERIVLFGSAARGEMGPNSDIDLLVIKGGKFHRGRVTQAIYRKLYGVEAAVDVVVVTPEDIAHYCHAACLVIAPALSEGKIVYGA